MAQKIHFIIVIIELQNNLLIDPHLDINPSTDVMNCKILNCLIYGMNPKVYISLLLPSPVDCCKKFRQYMLEEMTPDWS
jgi:hypothetical protein